MNGNVALPKGFLPLGSQVRQPKVGTIADTILQFYADKFPHKRSRIDYRYWIGMLKRRPEIRQHHHRLGILKAGDFGVC